MTLCGKALVSSKINHQILKLLKYQQCSRSFPLSNPAGHSCLQKLNPVSPACNTKQNSSMPKSNCMVGGMCFSWHKNQSLHFFSINLNIQSSDWWHATICLFQQHHVLLSTCFLCQHAQMILIEVTWRISSLVGFRNCVLGILMVGSIYVFVNILQQWGSGPGLAPLAWVHWGPGPGLENLPQTLNRLLEPPVSFFFPFISPLLMFIYSD